MTRWWLGQCRYTYWYDESGEIQCSLHGVIGERIVGDEIVRKRSKRAGMLTQVVGREGGHWRQDVTAGRETSPFF